MRDIILTIYPWVKAFHLIMVVAWMAAMMYLPRLFIYHHQAAKDGEAERFFLVMERRLLKGIMTPAMAAVWLAALIMLAANPGLLSSGWFVVKLAAVLAISGVHGFYVGSYRKFEQGERPKTEKFWRLINEVPFIFMILAVVMVIVKPF